MQFGLLGRSLAHSLSPQIHGCFGDYPYALFSREPEDLPAFFQDRSITGFNVTIPYKIDAFRACNDLSETAKAIGAVNTVIRRPDGSRFAVETENHEEKNWDTLGLLFESIESTVDAACVLNYALDMDIDRGGIAVSYGWRPQLQVFLDGDWWNMESG